MEKNIEIPSVQFLQSKLQTKKAKKRSPRRQIAVLTAKLTRKHVRGLYKDYRELETQRQEAEESWKRLGSS